MSSWIAYKGLNVPNSPTGDAGIYLKSDLQALADRVGPCNFTATANPTTSNDLTQGYQVGSLWINTATNTWFVCTNNAVGAAVWNTYQAPLSAGEGITISGGTVGITPQSGHSEVVVTDTSGDLTTADTTNTEIGYVHGVTSAIQTQLDAKQATLTAGTGVAISGATISNTLATATQSANQVFAGPSSGSAAAPSFRSLTAADMPSGVGLITEVENADGSGDLTFTNASANIWYGSLTADDVGATQAITLPNGSTSQTVQLTIDGTNATGYALFALPSVWGSQYIYVGQGLIVSTILAWNGVDWLVTTPQWGMTEIEHTAGDGSGNVTFTNPIADVYIAILTGSDTIASISLPGPSQNRQASLIADGSQVGANPSIQAAGFGLFGCVSTGDSIIAMPIYWGGTRWIGLAIGLWNGLSAGANNSRGTILDQSGNVSVVGQLKVVPEEYGQSYVCMPSLPTSPGSSGSGQLYTTAGVVSAS